MAIALGLQECEKGVVAPAVFAKKLCEYLANPDLRRSRLYHLVLTYTSVFAGMVRDEREGKAAEDSPERNSWSTFAGGSTRWQRRFRR